MKRAFLTSIAIGGALLFANVPGSLADNCMEDVAGFALQCTANDIQIASVTDIDITDPCEYPGDMVTFDANFELVTTAKERHDIGVYFANAGNPNAITGSCVNAIIPEESDYWFDLDGTSDPFPGTNDISNVQDLCGDINKTDHNNLMPRLTITAQCVDSDNDGYLNLPYCISWRQAGANELCLAADDAFPGSPSKCKCDDTFNVPVPVPPATLLVDKTPSVDVLQEPGGEVTFHVIVNNTGVDPDNYVQVTGLEDSIYGDLSYAHGAITETSCQPNARAIYPIGDQDGRDIPYECDFTVYINSSAFVEHNVVTAYGLDFRGYSISGEDDADVTVEDVLPTLTLSKTASVDEILEPGGQVTFTVLITNTSAATDPVTLHSLTDTIYGDLNGQGTCSNDVAIQPGASYSCSFTGDVSGNAGYSETDTVTASGTDDEGNPVSASDSATVLIENVLSEISMTKSASPEEVYEPSGSVTYTYTITNESTVDTVTLNVLNDDRLGNLNGQGSCSVPQTLLPEGSYSCALMATVAGNANTSVTNVATAEGVDDDGDPVSAMADATVDILNVAPAASVTKTAVSAIVTYEVVVTNDSDAEPLFIETLNDDRFGDITTVHDKIQSTNCDVGAELAESPNGIYTCTFSALVDTSPHTNTVSAAVIDDDGSAAVIPTASATVTFE